MRRWDDFRRLSLCRLGCRAYLDRPICGSVDMGGAPPASPEEAWAQARELCAQAARLRRQAASRRRRSVDLCAELAEILLEAGTPVFGGRGEHFRLRLGRLPPMVRFARHDLRRWLEAARLPGEVVDEVALACSEACANAVEHPREPRRQLVEIEGRLEDAQLELRVRDYGYWNERPRSGLRGRGLRLIGELMDSFDVQRRSDGTEIVMRRAIPPAT